MRNWIYVLVLLAVGYIATSNDLRHQFGGSIAAVAKPLLVPVVEMFLDPQFIYTISSLIFMGAILSCVAFFIGTVRPNLARMQTLRADIIRLLQLKSMRAVLPEAPPSLKTLGDSLQKLGLFTVPWFAFQKEIALTKVVPSYPFSYFVAIDPDANEIEGDELMVSLPGYFVSVGLILTFSGLVIALYFAAKGFRTGSMEQSREAVLQLLNASAFKFLTSIAALGSALLITVFHAFCESLVRAGRAACVSAIESYIAEFRVSGTEAIGDLANDSLDIESKIEILSDKIMKLNTEISRLSASISSAGKAYAIEK